MRIIVTSAVQLTELDANPKILFREVYNNMCKSLGLSEPWFFGLYYQPGVNIVWLDTSKKALKDLTSAARDLHFNIKYYPEEIAHELIEKVTIQLFFAEIRNAIISDNIFCPPDTSALLASYALQAKQGDYESDVHNKHFFKKQTLLSKRILKQHDLDISSWIDIIINMWIKLAGMDAEESMMEYLKLAQNLEMYGVTYFEIRNKRGTRLLLGMTSLGMNIYKPEDRINPQVAFPWAEIKRLTFRDTKFVIKPIDKKTTDFVLITASGKISKQILNLGVGNHHLYIRRRKPEDPEIQRMRERALEQRKLKQYQKDILKQERTAREESERRELKYKENLLKIKEELDQSRNNLLEANKIIEKLQKQLASLKQSKEELESEQKKLKEMMELLQYSKNLEAQEKLKLENEISAKQKQVQLIQNEVALKDQEAKRLQEQVEEARKKEEEYIRKQKIEEEERLRQEEEERNKEEGQDLELLPEGANTALPELVQVNESLQEQLKALQNKLDQSRKEDEDSDLDRIHRINLRQGKDKYKTLKDIRRGNTVRRVEMFENL